MPFAEYPLHYLHKAAPILILLVWSFSSIHGVQQKLMALALCFSATGDVLLALPLNLSFVLGLAAFLVAHLFYIVAFSKFETQKRLLSPPLIVLLVYFSLMLFFILPNVGDLFIPVMVYMLVIFTMVVFAIRITPVNRMVIIGACLFVFSDSMIAINKFVTAIPYEGALIMVSYYLAQWCIVYGVISITPATGTERNL